MELSRHDPAAPVRQARPDRARWGRSLSGRPDPKSLWEEGKFLQLGKGQGGWAGWRWRFR